MREEQEPAAPAPGGPNDGGDPIAQMAAGATGYRMLFNSYVLAGFTEAQALYLLGVLIGAMTRAAFGPGSAGG